MINLFSVPETTIHLGDFNHILHDEVVTLFEQEFAEYVGAHYAVSISSASNAIFLLMRDVAAEHAYVPSMIPPVVVNSLIHARKKVYFTDDTEWVGGSYILHQESKFKIIDSAQRVDRDQFKNECAPNDIVFFSFYPTKPVGGIDGGMIVSDDAQAIRDLRAATFYGETQEINSWEKKILFPGYKMYMSAPQAVVARESLELLDERKEKLSIIREKYNRALELENTSDHLYRITVDNNQKFLKHMRMRNITCGIHYNSLHNHPTYLPYSVTKDCKRTEKASRTTASIPFHTNLSERMVDTIIGETLEYFRK